MKIDEINNNFKSISDEYKMNNSDNDEITMTKKDFTSPERFSVNINNNNKNKIENIQKKKIKNNIINETKNIISKSFGNKKKSKDKIKKTNEIYGNKKIHKFNTVTRINRLNKNLDNTNTQLNAKINNSTSSTTISKTLNKSYKSSLNKINTKIKTSKEEKTNDEFGIPKKYLNTDYILLKTLNSDGKIVNIYSNNKLEVIFKSGVKKEIFEDGYQIVNFTNGDLKQIFPDGKIIYYFKESKVTQTTFNDGTQIFKFDNGQIEKHYSDGSKQISFPDGSVRYIYPNGYEETYNNQDENNEDGINLKKEEL